MRLKVAALGALLGISALGIAGGTAGLDALAEACGFATLPAAKEHLAVAESAMPDVQLDLVTEPGLPLDEEVDTHSCVGEIRPGAKIPGCTMSWVFHGDDGNTYFSTAGHCTRNLGQVISVEGVGPAGEVVFRVNGGVGNDIALIRVYADKLGFVNPTLCHWGGPSGIATPGDGSLAGHDLMLHYGWGVNLDYQLTRARAGAILSSDWVADGSVRMWGVTNSGDSGSPMMLSNGLAAGVHTHRLVGFPVLFSQKAATRLDMMIPRAEAALGIDLEISQGQPVDLTGLSIT